MTGRTEGTEGTEGGEGAGRAEQAGALEENTVAIVRLGWARSLGLPDDALAARVVEVPRDDVVSVVRLFGTVVAVGPAWFLDDPAGWHLDGPALLRGVAARAGTRPRLLGAAALAYADAYVEHPGLSEVEVSDEPSALAEVVRRCPADDVGESGLTEMERVLVTLADGSDEGLAAAGHDVRGGLVAQLGVLTPPERRGQGHGLLAAALATNDALDAGLVAQWRCRTGHDASLRLAARLGYVPAGSQTTVLLGAPAGGGAGRATGPADRP
ncbi:GNAT family N-acetyltransferase [Cellulomonas endophytica]|uniref:GNAT family N-acetyltransferase n=1 Tax=Cellulomonas endophytica TaxID=2494735 RepID=UPI001011506F|nr:GNAT family N-acetyltransferase [Cellulomonas endophytica]